MSGRSDIPAESRWTARSTNNPIEDFDSDILGRTAIVEMLAEHTLQHRTPVLALNGDLGDGKTSVLNLLNKAIEPYAVVVPFSAWLPGSEVTLAIDLFRAIAAKCNEYVWIPHHRKRALAFARTLSGSVHGLSGFKELLPDHSQQDEIRELRDTFSRLNRPIVILIDEIDRMQKDELLVLLKILRGVSSIPNVSFICAFSGAVVRRQLDVENLASDYLEKFFPVSINLSAPSPDLVGHCFRAEMVRESSNQGWFRTPTESNEFVKLMGEAWEDSLQPLCTNLRKAGLLINDSISTGRAIVREVNPLDLVLIEAIRHFSPSIYSVIKANAPNLAGSNQNLYLVNKETTKQFFVELNTRIDNYEQSAAIKMLLYRLFPKYAATSQSKARIPFGSDQREGESSENSSKRICKPDYFWIYFRNALPEEMFSNAELDQVLAELSKSGTDAEVETVFAKALGSMARGHAKRADFFRKLGLKSEELDASTSESLSYAVAEHASDYQYDLFNGGESPQALNLVLIAAQKVTPSDAQRILKGAISRASNDVFAVRLFESTTRQNLHETRPELPHIDPAAVTQSFVARMRKRYNSETANSELVLSQADWMAFRDWAEASDEDSRLQQAFWPAFVGSSPKRLAQAIPFVYPPFYRPHDRRPMVERVFPIKDLEKLMHELPESDDLTEEDRKSLARMRDLLDGKFQTGLFA